MRNNTIFKDNNVFFRTYAEFKKKVKQNREELKKYANIYIKDKKIKLKWWIRSISHLFYKWDK